MSKDPRLQPGQPCWFRIRAAAGPYLKYVWPFLAAITLLTGPARLAHACACGCGVFEVGTSSMFPTHPGAMLSLAYDYMNQDQNWSGTAKASADDNDDKVIRTHFVTVHGQYTVSRAWTFAAKLPLWDRAFTTAGDDGDVATFEHSSLGDVRLLATYTGFSEDLSTGFSFGLKLPTGDDSYGNFDRDTEIGSGSTDLLLGAHHMGALSRNRAWNWFAQATWEQPFATRGDYRPGSEGDFALGVYDKLGSPAALVRVSPLLQLIASTRSRDSGAESDPGSSGYARLLIAPGAEVRLPGIRVYGDLELPLYQQVNGNQLVAPRLLKLVLSYGS